MYVFLHVCVYGWFFFFFGKPQKGWDVPGSGLEQKLGGEKHSEGAGAYGGGVSGRWAGNDGKGLEWSQDIFRKEVAKITSYTSPCGFGAHDWATPPICAGTDKNEPLFSMRLFLLHPTSVFMV